MSGRELLMMDADILWATGPDVISTIWGNGASEYQDIRLRGGEGMLRGRRSRANSVVRHARRVGLDRLYVAHRESGAWRTGIKHAKQRMPPMATRSRGIAMALGRPQDVAMGLALIEMIRTDYACNLPMEVWHADELTTPATALIAKFNASVHRI